jgi:hypothetical protein
VTGDRNVSSRNSANGLRRWLVDEAPKFGRPIAPSESPCAAYGRAGRASSSLPRRTPSFGQERVPVESYLAMK